MSVRNCSPLALPMAPVTIATVKQIDFVVFIMFFRFPNPVCPLITTACQKVHSFMAFLRLALSDRSVEQARGRQRRSARSIEPRLQPTESGLERTARKWTPSVND